jgi:hypothetical protein
LEWKFLQDLRCLSSINLEDMECNLGIMSLRLHAWSKIHLYKQDFRLGKGIKLNVFQQQMDQTTK